MINLWVIALAALVGVVCLAHAGVPPDDRINEVLVQLSELRKSQGDLAKALSELKVEVAALRGERAQEPVTSFDLRDPNYPVLGSPTAGVAMVEFSDFQCPFCRRYQQTTMPTITSKYITSGKIKYVFLNFPLSFHEQAEPAALAGACAQRQGAFWKMRGLLFDSQAVLGAAAFATMASTLKLNGVEFNRCLQDPQVAAQINEQAQLGKSVGVDGTPAFLIGRVHDGVLTNATLVSGAQPLESFQRVIEPLLAGAGIGQ